MAELQLAAFLLFCAFHANRGHGTIHCGDLLPYFKVRWRATQNLAYWWPNAFFLYEESLLNEDRMNHKWIFHVVWQECWGAGWSVELVLVCDWYFLLDPVNNQSRASTWLLLAFHTWIKTFRGHVEHVVHLLLLGFYINKALEMAQKPLSVGDSLWHGCFVSFLG